MRFAVAPLFALLYPACILAQPVPGSDIPGPFTAYNVTGKYKGRYHCQVSENGLNPVVMVVVRGVEPQEGGLKTLLGNLDRAIEKNPTTRLAGFVVFLSNTLKDVAKDDKEREALEPKLGDIARDSMLKHVVVCLDAPTRLAAWKLDADADVTVVLYKDLRTVAVHKLTWEQLKQPPDEKQPPAKVKEILEQVRDKFKATR